MSAPYGALRAGNNGAWGAPRPPENTNRYFIPGSWISQVELDIGGTEGAPAPMQSGTADQSVWYCSRGTNCYKVPR